MTSLSCIPLCLSSEIGITHLRHVYHCSLSLQMQLLQEIKNYLEIKILNSVNSIEKLNIEICLLLFRQQMTVF